MSTERMVGSHPTCRSSIRYIGLKLPMNVRILVLELNLGATLLDAGVTGAVFGVEAHETVAPASPAQRQVPGGPGSGIEMLVKPLQRRNHDAPRLPVHFDPFLPFLPEKGIALPDYNRDV